jgi:hypothetical protein
VTTWQSRPGTDASGAAPTTDGMSGPEHNEPLPLWCGVGAAGDDAADARDREWRAAVEQWKAAGWSREEMERASRDRFGILAAFGLLPEDYEPGDDDDPPAARDARNVPRDLWMILLRGQITPDTPGVGPRRHTTILAVAFFLASWANGADGRRARPGEVNLCAATGLSDRTVRTALHWLDTAGWITRTRLRNRRAGRSDEYRLSVPADVAATWDGDAR